MINEYDSKRFMNARKLPVLLVPFLFITSLFAEQATQGDFAWAYSQDAFWPAHVTPKEAIADASGSILLQANIPVVLIRAYEDGQLYVLDRSGNLLIDHAKTNFIDQIKATLASEREAKTNILLHQLGRRTYDRSYHQSKAVSELELARYSRFMLIRTSSEEAPLQATLEALHGMREHFNDKKIRPVLVFDEHMPNQKFYELVKQFEIPYPVVAPIFQKGLIEALFSKREQDSRVLLLSISGKLIETYTGLEDELLHRYNLIM